MITKTGSELACIGLDKTAVLLPLAGKLGGRIGGFLRDKGTAVSKWINEGAQREGMAGKFFQNAQAGINNAALANRSIRSNWGRLSRKGKIGVGIGGAGLFGAGYMAGRSSGSPVEPVYKTY
jgi:hypothetical protein